MSSNTAVTAIAVASGITGVLWIILLLAPISWFSSTIIAIRYQVTLFSVFVSPGLGTKLLTGAVSLFNPSLKKFLEDKINSSFWLFDFSRDLGQISSDLGSRWNLAAGGSLLMLVLGMVAAVLLIVAGMFAHYYATSHATHTGRTWIRGCLVAAPCLVVSGMLQYLLTTWGASIEGHLESSSYDIGFFLANTLTVLTFIPLFMHATFFKVHAQEKNGEDEAMAFEAGYGENTYGAAQGGLPAVPQGNWGPEPYQQPYSDPYQQPYQQPFQQAYQQPAYPEYPPPPGPPGPSGPLMAGNHAPAW